VIEGLAIGHQRKVQGFASAYDFARKVVAKPRWHANPIPSGSIRLCSVQNNEL
jgi:hypothetical protein